ncbi:methyltransferase [Parerythrobacter aurantius]|uniref:class I SAM-dependent methyltransferase n=1 Tax=Parerythrobacter aurantius TaxID=3127706 RepID=UPI00325208DF
MKKLIVAAIAGAFALAVPALADGHMKSGAGHDMSDPATFAAHYAEALSGAINHPTRAEDRARDKYRHPAETLSFFRVAPDMKVGEYSPGGGWYSRLLGHYLGGEGQLVGIYANPLTVSSDPARQQRIRDAAAGFSAEVAGYTGLPAEKFGGITLENIGDDQRGTFDRILVMRALHGITRGGTADTEIRALRDLLKDDGLLGIEQHRAKADAAWSYANGSKGYLKQQDVIDFMRLNGFELVATSEISANPMDTADHPEGVWEMPPVLRTKREDLKDKGESDRMTLLFRKAQ